MPDKEPEKKKSLLSNKHVNQGGRVYKGAGRTLSEHMTLGITNGLPCFLNKDGGLFNIN